MKYPKAVKMNKCKDCKYFDVKRDVAFLDGDIDTTRRACTLISTDYCYDGGYEDSDLAEIKLYTDGNEALFIVNEEFGCVEWDGK